MSTENRISSEHPPVSASHQVLSSGAQDLPRMDHPHAPKFRVVMAVLAGIAVAAVAVAVVVASRGKNSVNSVSSANWSSWTPGTSGSAGISEIAQYVSPYYRVSGSQQLDVITPMRLAQSTAAGTTTGSGLTIAVNESTGGKQSLGLLNGSTIAYEVCGLGAKNCGLLGTPSVHRMLLLRREALELALYTFEYIGNSQNVVVVLPPGHTVTSGGTNEKGLTVALVFLRRDLQPWLTVPLSRTLQQYPPELSELSPWSKSQEAAFVDQVTAHFLFSSQVEALQEGGSALVLTPLPAQ
ncbi:MAG TPA: hypothetical protein VG293_03890 [Solirubrobacteraceae bacterium]|jgi:hypothetical protein|nr:hypothetical protein [Solirubrobacteraceae bacterium]